MEILLRTQFKFEATRLGKFNKQEFF